jgi:integrase
MGKPLLSGGVLTRFDAPFTASATRCRNAVASTSDAMLTGPVMMTLPRPPTAFGLNADVAKKLNTALESPQQGTLVTGPRQTVAQHFEHWLEDVVRPHLRPRSYVAYSSKVRIHILPTLGRLPITRLTPQHLQRLYATKLASGLSPKSVNNLHVVIHRGLEYALRWGLAARNVADAVEPPRVPRRVLQPFAPEELVLFLRAVARHRNEALWVLMLATGLRFGEAAALRWCDVDLEQRVIHAAEPRVAALRALPDHHAGTPGRVAARVAAQRPAKGSETALDAAD